MSKKSTKAILIFLIILYLVFYKKLGISIPCFFHKITGLYCPGCGITRMLESILKLNIYQAFRYNTLAFTYLIGYIIYKIINYRHKIKLNNYFIYVLLFITITFGILRNIPIFDYLKPTEIISNKN